MRPSDAIRIRPAQPSDLDLIVRFNRRLAEESEGRSLDPEILRAGVRAVLEATDKGRYFVAEVDGAVAGQLMVTSEWSDWRNGWFWWIQSVYVDPAFRGRGVYRALHQHVERIARGRGDVRGLRLYVEEANHRARETYSRLGMRKTGYLLYETDWSFAVR